MPGDVTIEYAVGRWKIEIVHVLHGLFQARTLRARAGAQANCQHHQEVSPHCESRIVAQFVGAAYFLAGWRKERSTMSLASVDTGPSRHSQRIISGMIMPPYFWPWRFMLHE